MWNTLLYPICNPLVMQLIDGPKKLQFVFSKPCQMFIGKAGAYRLQHLKGAPFQGRLLSWPYPQILGLIVKACLGQTLQLIWPILKFDTLVKSKFLKISFKIYALNDLSFAYLCLLGKEQNTLVYMIKMLSSREYLLMGQAQYG